METFGFNLKLAKMIGTNEAIFLQMLYDIIERNKSVCVIEDNTIWFPCAIKEWSYYIDFWNYRQVDRIVKNCINQKALFLRNYDEDERRRRGWYGINNEIVPMLEKVRQDSESGWR